MAAARDAHVPTALVLCGEATVPSAVLERTVTDAGFEIVARVRHWSEAIERVADTKVDVAVVDLALTGTLGVRAVQVLRTAAPWTEVVVLSPWEEIDVAAFEAGAMEVVRGTDLRPLTAALRDAASRMVDANH